MVPREAIVRTVNGDRVERYDCQCGKFYWLSQADGRKPLVRYRTVPPRWGAGAWTDATPGGVVKGMNLHGDKGAAAGLIAMAGALVLLAIVVIVVRVLA